MSEQFEFDGKQCEISQDNPEKLVCQDPDTGEVEEMGIDEVDL